MIFNLPQNIEFILNTLTDNGHYAYIVGGCVRDLLCGKTPHDYDITTAALPQTTKSLFKKTVDTGLKHGTVTVIVDDIPVEVTTFRTENRYTDSRHPDKVNFVSSIHEDLARRDFTVNAMCYNKLSGLIDIFGGKDDIKQRTLRAVGDAETRFKEDALRILRLFRFSSTLGFKIEENTLSAALCCAPLIENISSERVLSELYKAALGENITCFSPLLSSGALQKYALYSADLSALPLLENKEDLKLFAFLNLSSRDFYKTLDNLKCSNKFKDYASKMHTLCNTAIKADRAEIKRALGKANPQILFDAISYYREVLGIDTKPLEEILKSVIKSGEPYITSHLDILGDDIINLGFSGKEVGNKLQFLLEKVIENPELNQKEKLIKLICN